jgi:hypothetical protein
VAAPDEASALSGAPAVQTTTHPCTPLTIVNGPIATRLGISG